MLWDFRCWMFVDFHIRWLSPPMSMLGVLLLIHYGLWIVAIIHCGVVVVDVPWFWVSTELFWPR